MKISKVGDLTLLVTTPLPRDYPTNHLSKKSDKVMLVEDYVVRVTFEDSSTILIRVPKSYVTDGSSIPRVFRILWHPFVTGARRASCVHDRIYSHLYKFFSKKFADELLRFMIKRDGGSKFMQWCFYNAVRINFNGGGWKNK